MSVISGLVWVSVLLCWFILIRVVIRLWCSCSSFGLVVGSCCVSVLYSVFCSFFVLGRCFCVISICVWLVLVWVCSGLVNGCVEVVFNVFVYSVVVVGVLFWCKCMLARLMCVFSSVVVLLGVSCWCVVSILFSLVVVCV